MDFENHNCRNFNPHFYFYKYSQLRTIRPRVRSVPRLILTLPLAANSIDYVSWKFGSSCNLNKIFTYFLFKFSSVDCKIFAKTFQISNGSGSLWPNFKQNCLTFLTSIISYFYFNNLTKYCTLEMGHSYLIFNLTQ